MHISQKVQTHRDMLFRRGWTILNRLGNTDSALTSNPSNISPASKLLPFVRTRPVAPAYRYACRLCDAVRCAGLITA